MKSYNNKKPCIKEFFSKIPSIYTKGVEQNKLQNEIKNLFFDLLKATNTEEKKYLGQLALIFNKVHIPAIEKSSLVNIHPTLSLNDIKKQNAAQIIQNFWKLKSNNPLRAPSAISTMSKVKQCTPPLRCVFQKLTHQLFKKSYNESLQNKEVKKQYCWDPQKSTSKWIFKTSKRRKFISDIYKCEAQFNMSSKHCQSLIEHLVVQLE